MEGKWWREEQERRRFGREGIEKGERRRRDEVSCFFWSLSLPFLRLSSALFMGCHRHR